MMEASASLLSTVSALALSYTQVTRIRPKQFSSVFQEGECHLKTSRFQKSSLWGLPWWPSG